MRNHLQAHCRLMTSKVPESPGLVADLDVPTSVSGGQNEAKKKNVGLLLACWLVSFRSYSYRGFLLHIDLNVK